MNYSVIRNIDKVAAVLRGVGLHRLTRVSRDLLDIFFTKGICIQIEEDIISVPLRDRAFLYAVKESHFEANTVKLFAETVKPEMIVIDIGAYVGYFTLLAARRVGANGKVYAFEPEPKTYRFLKRNICLNEYKNVITVPKAVSNQSGTVKLYINSSDASMTSLFRRKGSHKAIEIECTTIDDFFHEQRVDVVKMDIEGAEPYALEGIRNTIERNPNLVLFVELNPVALKEAGSTSDKLKCMLEDLGFNDIVALDEQRNEKGKLLLCNLYCRRLR